MTTSSKKKKEKKKDFKKTKLKVGRVKPKAANSTDTSFRAKSIALKQQALSASAPTIEAQCTHHLGLLNHKSDVQRKESLAFLTSVVVNNPPSAPLPQPASVIVPGTYRLILDGSSNVRQQLLKLLQSFSARDIASHAEQLLLHTRAAMTHLSSEIQAFGLDVLDWLLHVVGDEIVSCPGGWVKMLKCFISLLGWQSKADSKWSTTNTITRTDSKIQVKQMNALALFLRGGLIHTTAAPTILGKDGSFPLWQVEHHVLSERSNVYAHLNLFGSTRDEDAEMYEDREDRQRIFHEMMATEVSTGVEQAIKGGGKIGRAAAQIRKAIREGMADFHREENLS